MKQIISTLEDNKFDSLSEEDRQTLLEKIRASLKDDETLFSAKV